MKKLFVVLCDIMVIAAVVCVFSLAVWIVTAFLWAPVAEAARAVFIAAVAVAGISTAGAFIAWKHGGAPGDNDPGPSPWEGEE